MLDRIADGRTDLVFYYVSERSSLASVRTLKTIYPVSLNDVIALLNDEEKTIDVVICFKERRRGI